MAASWLTDLVLMGEECIGLELYTRGPENHARVVSATWTFSIATAALNLTRALSITTILTRKTEP